MQKENLEDRINYLEKEVERIKKMYEKTIAYEETDPEVSLQQARKAAEAICKNLYINEVNPNAGKLMLEDLIRKLIENKVIPQKIVVPLRTIQGYGNLASHDNGEDPDSITSEYIQPCIGSLSTLVSWYFEEYCSAENISKTIQRKAPSNDEKSKIKDFELDFKTLDNSSTSKKNGKKLKYAVITIAALLAVFIGIKAVTNKDSGAKKDTPQVAAQSSQTSGSNSTNNTASANTQQQATAKPVQTGTETAVDRYVEKYDGKIKFGVTTVNIDGDKVYVNFYVDNKSSKEVSVAIFKNVYLLDASGNQFEAKPQESKDFSNVTSGAKVSGKIAFEASGIKEASTLTLKGSYWIMDPSAGDTKIVIPFK